MTSASDIVSFLNAVPVDIAREHAGAVQFIRNLFAEPVKNSNDIGQDNYSLGGKFNFIRSSLNMTTRSIIIINNK
jgi:hypothetical protein